MAVSLKNISKSEVKPPRMIIYGESGVGKTTFACSAPKPIVIQTEDGLGVLDVDCFPKATSFREVMESLTALGAEEHSYKTVVIDSLDWLEPLVWSETCRRLGVDSIEAPGYGRGYVEASNVWLEFFSLITDLRDYKKMIVIMTAHSQIVRVEAPEHPPYDRYGLKLHKRASALAEEYSDILGFASSKILTKVDDPKAKKQRVRAIDGMERILHVTTCPAYAAKNRYEIDEDIVLTKENSWEALASKIKTSKKGA